MARPIVAPPAVAVHSVPMARARSRRRSSSSSAIVPYRPPPPVRVAPPPPVVIRTAPAPRRARMARRSSSARSSGGGGGIFGLGRDTTAALAAGGVVGLLKKSGILDEIPRLPVIGRLGAAAIGAALIARQTGSALAGDVSRALATLAAYQLAVSEKDWDERIDGSVEIMP